jgi:hypothetical protein
MFFQIYYHHTLNYPRRFLELSAISLPLYRGSILSPEKRGVINYQRVALYSLPFHHSQAPGIPAVCVLLQFNNESGSEDNLDVMGKNPCVRRRNLPVHANRTSQVS